jgi:hypothetical protein
LYLLGDGRANSPVPMHCFHSLNVDNIWM